MRVSFLGTGDAGGVPFYGCNCAACIRARAVVDFRRRPCTALVEVDDTRILLDAGLTDLTERFPSGSLSAIVLTHFHVDHVQSLFHLRWGIGKTIPVYGPPDSAGCADLYRNHGLLEFRRLTEFEPVTIGNLVLTPLPLVHSKVTFGYAVEATNGQRFAYLTDTAGLPPGTEAFLISWRPAAIALDCSYPPLSNLSRNHNDLTLALTIVEALAPATVWLTHVGHELDAWLLKNIGDLPPRMGVAYDAQVVSDADFLPVTLT